MSRNGMIALGAAAFTALATAAASLYVAWPMLPPPRAMAQGPAPLRDELEQLRALLDHAQAGQPAALAQARARLAGISEMQEHAADPLRTEAMLNSLAGRLEAALAGAPRQTGRTDALALAALALGALGLLTPAALLLTRRRRPEPAGEAGEPAWAREGAETARAALAEAQAARRDAALAAGHQTEQLQRLSRDLDGLEGRLAPREATPDAGLADIAARFEAQVSALAAAADRTDAVGERQARGLDRLEAAMSSLSAALTGAISDEEEALAARLAALVPQLEAATAEARSTNPVLKSLATLAVQAMGRLSEEGAARVGLAAELAASAAFADARARFGEAAERVEAAARAIADAEPHEAGASEAALARIGFAIDEGITRIEAALLAGPDLPSRLDAGVPPTSEIAPLAEAPADGFAWLDSVETRGAPLLHEPEAVAEGGLPRRREV